MSTATQGRNREYRVRDHLVSLGWVSIMRAAASKGAADLLLAHETFGPVLVQVGTHNKDLGPADRERFLTAAALCRAVPLVATCRPGTSTVSYYLLIDATARHWPAWDPVTGRAGDDHADEGFQTAA